MTNWTVGIHFQCQHFFFSVVERIFTELEPLTQLDPNLLYIFMFVCPKQDFVKLVARVSPYISIAFLATELRSINIYEREVYCDSFIVHCSSRP